MKTIFQKVRNVFIAFLIRRAIRWIGENHKRIEESSEATLEEFGIQDVLDLSYTDNAIAIVITKPKIL
jgi:hypothetical protein